MLNALCRYYERMLNTPHSEMPTQGYSSEGIHYAIHIDSKGKLERIIDYQKKGEDNKIRPRKLNVPAAKTRSPNVLPFTLWDKSDYVLGRAKTGSKKRIKECFDSFKELHRKLADEYNNPKLESLALFLESWNPQDMEGEEKKYNIKEGGLLGKNLVFMWDEDLEYLHDDPEIREIMHKEWIKTQNTETGHCLIHGGEAEIAKIHPNIKGVMGGKTSGGSIVSFNAPAFESYGKKQGLNAPISFEAAAAYTSALNFLLDRENERRIQIADASTVFWAEESGKAEDLLYSILSGSYSKENEDKESDSEENGKDFLKESRKEKRLTKNVASILSNLRNGIPVGEAVKDINPDMNFYILSLAPNAARISIRFWLSTSFGELAKNIGMHHKDISLEKQYANQAEFPTAFRLLLETTKDYKATSIVSALASKFMRSMLTGSRYPYALLVQLITRIKVSGDSGGVNYYRASMIKAILNRNYNKGLDIMLDETRKDQGYILGRLFAVFEKAQEDALGKVNSSIRDRYMGSASATPGAVFPRLLRLTQHHISKADFGAVSDKRIEGIMQNIDAFPARLSMEDQGMFFIGYYHQRNSHYISKDEKSNKSEKSES